ncbi:MAG TPA: DHA2 family efflux MFS transporter permease subunit [Terriglobia bacterium]|nr:DHA2 family efflux MFS transporter permease subunit [Terriglobia bacterium]
MTSALPSSRLASKNQAVYRWLVAIAVMASAVMELVDTSAVNVSIPYIAGNLSASIDEATWVLTSYLVSNAVVLPLTGWLASRFGRKRLLMTAVAGFTIASMLCGLAPSLPVLIICRVLQGAFGGTLQPTTRAILLETFPREERGKAMAMWGVGIVVAPIVAPVLGGWLTTDYSWRWVFFINLPVSIAGLILVHLYVFDPPYLPRTRKSIDYWGLGMLVTGIASLQIVLDKGQESDWFSSRFILTLAIIAVLGIAAFVIWELVARDPMVHLHLLKYRTFATAVVLSIVLFFVLYGSILLLPLFMQEVLNFPAITAGVWNCPRGIATMILMPVAGYLIGRRWDMRALLFGGIIVSAIGVLWFSYLDLNTGPWNFLWPQVLMGAGLSFVFVPFATITVDPIPNEEMGFATSITGLTRNLGAGFGISIAATLLERRDQIHQVRLVAHLNPSNPKFTSLLSALQNHFHQEGASLSTANHQAMGALYFMVQHQASVLSYLDSFRILAFLFVIVAPLVWIMRKPRFKRQAGA